MKGKAMRVLAGVLVAGLVSVPLRASAGSFSFSGSFARDDNAQQVTFTLASAGTVTVRSLGFAGGLSAGGSLVPAGGFDTVVQVFDATGLLVALSDDGTCLQTGVDPATGFCLDAFWSDPLAAGTYTLYLTQKDNQASGPSVAEGFLRAGQGSFTGPAFLGTAGSSILVNGAQRTSAWALDLLGVDSAVVGGLPVELMRFAVE